MHVDKFRTELLLPAHGRAEELWAALAAAERDLESLIRAKEYDDEAAAAAQHRLDALRLEHERWHRRHLYLEGCLNGKTAADHVPLGVA